MGTGGWRFKSARPDHRVMDEWVECIDCGEEFCRDSSEWWKKRCYECWLAQKDGHRGQRQNARDLQEIIRLRAEVDRLRRVQEAQQMILAGLKDHLGYLIFAAHPDRNDSHPKANEVTRWLLEVRELLKGEG